MTTEIYAHSARWAEWTLRRNPLYLMSAVLMALGARLLLVDPTNAPGDMKLILVTLGVLQAYEWAVSGILVLLHRYRRSLEDKPSLLLVAVLFWTGPMAATIEMTALRIDFGVIIAVGVCLIALGELGFVERALGIRMTLPTRLAGSACVILLAVAPPFVRVPESGTGPNELYLYGAWWVLAGIALIGLGSLWSRPGREVEQLARRVMMPLNNEIAFLTMTVGITALHVVGMSHAFFCHAACFYVSPLIAATTIVAVEYLVRTGHRRHPAMFVVSTLPLIALLLATQPFDAHVSVSTLPWWLRDPMLHTALIAGATWWFGFLRHGAAPALHAGNASLALAAYRVISTYLSPETGLQELGRSGVVARDVITVALFAAAAYFAISACIRRSRPEALIALGANLAAVLLLAWQRLPADMFIICLTAGWSLLIGMHLAAHRPLTLLRIIPIGLIVVVTCAYDFSPALVWYARAHGLVLTGVLLLTGSVWRWTGYRQIACALGGAYAGFLLWRWTGSRGEPLTAAIVTGAFALLLIGALVSWYKQRLLNWIRRSGADEPAGHSKQLPFR